MKLNTTIKTLCAAVALAASAAANAAPFYIDIGTNYGPAGDQACPTCTGVKDEFLYDYDSSTTIFDSNGDYAISAGDFLSTSFGLGVGTLSTNQITGFSPNQTFGTESNNGYSSNWMISFSGTGLNGVVTGVTGAGVPLFAYGPGLLELYLTFDGVNYNNFMDVAITGGGATGVSTILVGEADFTQVDAGYNNLFHAADGRNCNGATGFFDIWTNCNDGAPVNFYTSMDTNILASQFTYYPSTGGQAPGIFTLTSNHDGSGTFSVPEPASLALLGMSLIGLGFASRRKTAA